jgi:hypothetical protein
VFSFYGLSYSDSSQLHASPAVPIGMIGYNAHGHNMDQIFSNNIYDCVMAHPTAAAAASKQGACVGYDLRVSKDPENDQAILNMRMLLPIVLSSIVGDETSPPKVRRGIIIHYALLYSIIHSYTLLNTLYTLYTLLLKGGRLHLRHYKNGCGS